MNIDWTGVDPRIQGDYDYDFSKLVEESRIAEYSGLFNNYVTQWW